MANPSCPLCGTHTDLVQRDAHGDGGDLYRCRDRDCNHSFVDGGRF